MFYKSRRLLAYFKRLKDSQVETTQNTRNCAAVITNPPTTIEKKKKQLQETVHSTVLLWCFYLLYMLYSNLSPVYCC